MSQIPPQTHQTLPGTPPSMPVEILDAPPPQEQAGGVSPTPDNSENPPAPPSEGGTPAPTSRPAVVQTAKPKPGRRPKGAPKGKPGKLSWVHGTKKKFFERRKEEWLRESEAKRAGDFYSKMAKLYHIKYGRKMRDDEDLEVDVEDPPDDAADEVVHEVLSDAEQALRAEEFKALRTRIGAWYRSEYGGLLKSDQASFKELFQGGLDGTPLKPQRGRINHFYSRKFYDTRIKPHVEERMEGLQSRAQLSGEAPPQLIDVVAKVTAERWEQETPEFRRECELSLDREHQQALAAWEASLADSPTETPEETAAALGNAAYYLQPFVDAIKTRFGMCATVLLAGPIGIREGRIGVQSVHAGKTKGLAPVNWPDFDWAGFKKVEDIMITFARECFSDAECKARAVAKAADDNEEESSESVRAIPPATASSRSVSTVPTRASASTAGQDTDMGDADRESERVEGGGDGPGDAEGGELVEKSGGERVNEGGGSVEECGGERVEEGGGRVELYEEHWQRSDRRRWTPELANAHVAFERGRTWGLEWAVGVRAYFDFEAACGYVDNGARIRQDTRPRQVNAWLTMGRKWRLPPSLGTDLGTRDTAESWVCSWWKWWTSLQPKERLASDVDLSRPELADWSEMAQLHGKNGLLLVMATLMWWGEVSQDDLTARSRWLEAVDDVTWVLQQVLASGDIASHNTSADTINPNANADTDTPDPNPDADPDDCNPDADPDGPAGKKRRKTGKGAGKKRQASGDKSAESDGPPREEAAQGRLRSATACE
ncbi:hypothetical protein MSAN_01318900 [Mycena sanguinolenta]|uniref:Uncharacterized protein n=1 Tax=Mycena sanguinolenta TaxID=230812 RepID=A0A8H6YDZ5_9AGAR|nr:hypothetical protein MSAN_01318900 [Mycena sanguinolenta]